MFAIIGSVGHPKANAAAKYPVVEAQNKDLNINVIRSAWRRMRKGHIKVGDLQPQKDVKGGGGVTGNSKSITGGKGSTGTTGSH
jgi:hypothetical protein